MSLSHQEHHAQNRRLSVLWLHQQDRFLWLLAAAALSRLLRTLHAWFEKLGDTIFQKSHLRLLFLDSLLHRRKHYELIIFTTSCRSSRPCLSTVSR